MHNEGYGSRKQDKPSAIQPSDNGALFFLGSFNGFAGFGLHMDQMVDSSRAIRGNHSASSRSMTKSASTCTTAKSKMPSFAPKCSTNDGIKLQVDVIGPHGVD